MLVFIYTNCDFFSISNLGMPEVSLSNVPVGLGDPGVVFLDDEYKPTAVDEGKLGLFVENNEFAKDVRVISEIENDDPNNQVVTRIVNMQNKSLISFFYHAGQRFPHKLVITMDGEEVTGRFGIYNTYLNTYSIEFFSEKGESERVEGLVLNKNVFSLYPGSNEELSETQDIRIRSIYATLGIYANMAVQIDERINTNGRSIFSNNVLKNIIVGALAAVSVAALVAVVILVPPSAIALPVIYLSGTTAILGLVSACAAAGAVIANAALPDESWLSSNIAGNQTPNNIAGEIPEVAVALNGFPVENDSAPRYLAEGESITFDFKIISLSALDDINDLIYPIELYNFLLAYTPNEMMFIPFYTPNARYFDVKLSGKLENIYDTVQIKFTRNSNIGYDDNGIVKFVIPFRVNIVEINNSTEGVKFQLSPEEDIRSWKNLFIFNFTVIEPTNE